MFTVAQFFEKQQLRVLAVPVSWVRDGCLLWPKLPSNEKLDKLRTGGNEFHGATKKIPIIMGRKYKSLQAAEAAAEDLLKQEVSYIEAKKKLLKHRKDKTVQSRPLKDYNKIIHEMTSSKMPAQLISDDLAQKRQIPDAPVHAFPDALIRGFPQQDWALGSTSSQSQEPPHQKQILGTEKEEAPCHLLQLQATGSGARPMGFEIYNPTASVQAGNQLDPSRPLNASNIVLPRQMQSLALARNEEANPNDVTSASVLELPQVQQQIQSIFVTDDNFIYINPPSNQSGAVGGSGNLVDPFSEIKNVMTSLKSEITKVGTAVATLRTEVTDMKNEMTRMKQDITEAINTSVRQVLDDCLEKSLPRFATMLDMDRRDQSVPQERKSVEEHKHINDEDDLINFNKMLSSKQIFEEYITYFTKIIPPITYYEKGDSACYLIVDCLFTRSFWNNFTWTGINRGNKSKRGFREFANVLQLLLAIVSVGDPTYTSIKLESFCKNRLFRYSKARSSSKQLRKSTCRRTRVKKDKDGNPVDAAPADDDENGDGSMDNTTTDSIQDESDGYSDEDIDNQDESDGDSYENSDKDIDMGAHVEISINSNKDLLKQEVS